MRAVRSHTVTVKMTSLLSSIRGGSVPLQLANNCVANVLATPRSSPCVHACRAGSNVFRAAEQIAHRKSLPAPQNRGR